MGVSSVQLPRLPRRVSVRPQGRSSLFSSTWGKSQRMLKEVVIAAWLGKRISKLITVRTMPSYVKRQTLVFDLHKGIWHVFIHLRKNEVMLRLLIRAQVLRFWSAGCLHALRVVFQQLWWWFAFWWTLLSQPGECLSVPGMMLLQNVIDVIWYHDSFCKIHLISFCFWDWLEPFIIAFPFCYPGQKSKDGSRQLMCCLLRALEFDFSPGNRSCLKCYCSNLETSLD